MWSERARNQNSHAGWLEGGGEGGGGERDQYLAADKVSCSRTEHSDYASGESQTSKPLILNLTFYHLSQCAQHAVVVAGMFNGIYWYTVKRPLKSRQNKGLKDKW